MNALPNAGQTIDLAPSANANLVLEVRIADANKGGFPDLPAWRDVARYGAFCASNHRRVRPVIAQNNPASASNAAVIGLPERCECYDRRADTARRCFRAWARPNPLHCIGVDGCAGHFALEGLPAAKYPLSASKRGFRTALYDDHEGYNTAIVTGQTRTQPT